MDLFLQYAMKIAGTLFLLLLIGYLWSADIDVSKTLTAPSNWVLKFKKHHTFNFSNKQTVAVRFPSDGNIALVMYSIAIVNTLEESVTIKDVKLRYRLDGKPFITESLVLQTGSIVGSTEPALMLTTGGEPRVNIILMNWKNLERRSVPIIPCNPEQFSPAAPFLFSASKMWRILVAPKISKL